MLVVAILIEFIDDIKIDNNLLDYYGLTTSPNLYFLQSEDEKEDNFWDSKVKIKEFKDTLKIPKWWNSLFYCVCYTIHYLRTKKVDKCDDDELRSAQPNNLFSKLSSAKKRASLRLWSLGAWETILHNKQSLDEQNPFSKFRFLI